MLNPKSKFIKKLFLPAIALLLVSLIYFGINGVQAEFSTKNKQKNKSDNLAERPLNIVAVNDNQTQNVVRSGPNQEKPKLTKIEQAPQIKNIPAAATESLKTKVVIRINAGSAAGNYPIDYINNENAYQLLVRIASKNNFKVLSQDYGWGIYVEGIGNLTQDGKDNFWFFYINGKISDVGAADYILRPNDLIEWRYHEWWIY